MYVPNFYTGYNNNHHHRFPFTGSWSLWFQQLAPVNFVDSELFYSPVTIYHVTIPLKALTSMFSTALRNSIQKHLSDISQCPPLTVVPLGNALSSRACTGFCVAEAWTD